MDRMVVVEEIFPDMIVKRFGSTVVYMKALYKCLIHSFKSGEKKLF